MDVQSNKEKNKNVKTEINLKKKSMFVDILNLSFIGLREIQLMKAKV
jgi:hypothetical protein